LKESSDGETLMVVGIWFQIWKYIRLFFALLSKLKLTLAVTFNIVLAYESYRTGFDHIGHSYIGHKPRRPQPFRPQTISASTMTATKHDHDGHNYDGQRHRLYGLGCTPE